MAGPERRPRRQGGSLAAIWAVVMLTCPRSSLAQETPRAVSVDTLTEGRIVVSNPFATGGALTTDRWKVTEELRIGQVRGTGPDALGDVAAITLDGTGRLYVLDIASKEVRVFDRDGRYLRSVARDGEGPGEFRYRDARLRVIGMVEWLESNGLWISYFGGDELIVDSLGNELHREPWTFPVLQSGEFPTRSWVVGGDSLGSIYRGLTVYARPPSAIEYPQLTYVLRLHMSPSHDVLSGDTLFLETRHVKMGPPKTTRARGEGTGISLAVSRPERVDAQQIVWAVGVGGELWLANRAAHLFHQVTFHGDTIRTVQLGNTANVPIGPVAESDYDAVIAELDVSPEGWLWARREDRGDGSAWDLFDNCGVYRGEAITPLSLASVHIGWGGVVHGVVSDALDVDYIVRLRFDKPDGSGIQGAACSF